MTALLLDHIALAARRLADGVAYAEAALGVAVPAGGRHPLMGTHNHLLRLGAGLFLEVIAPDPDAPPPARARWFGLDDPQMRADLARSPRLVTWIVRTPSIEEALGTVEGAAAPAVRLTRGALSWLILVPQDGSMPQGGAFPTIIEWPSGPHPAERMHDHGCRLTRLTVEHPRGLQIARALEGHLRDNRVRFREAPGIRLEAEIATPDGPRLLR
ncbi:VOC family protein [soil metagenome]